MNRKLNEAGLLLPPSPLKWVVQCQKVGRGEEALRYLSRYLCRGVISNNDDGEQVTFRYRESQTHALKTHTLSGEDFLKRLLAYCLPKGFR